MYVMCSDLLCGGPCRDSDDNGPKGGNNEFSKCGSCKKNMYPIKLYVHDAISKITLLKLLHFSYKGI